MELNCSRRAMPCCVYVLSCFSCVQFIETLWTVACQAPLSMGFSRQEHWSGLLCPPPGDLPDPRMEATSLMSVSCIGRWVLCHQRPQTYGLQNNNSPSHPLFFLNHKISQHCCSLHICFILPIAASLPLSYNTLLFPAVMSDKIYASDFPTCQQLTDLQILQEKF